MSKRCIGCGVELQSADENKIGYANSMDNPLCKRCYEIKNFNKAPQVKLDASEFDKILSGIGESKNPIIWVIDIFNFDGSYLEAIRTAISENPVFIIVNKFDLLPKSVKIEKVKKWIFNEVSEEIDLLGIEVISAKKKNNIDQVMNKIKKMNFKIFYVIGTTNTGKSTFINTVIKSIDPNRKTEILTSQYSGTTLSSIKVKISKDLTLFDTPGIENESQITNLLEKENLQKIVPKKEIRPVTYQKQSDETFIVGIAINDGKNLFEMGKLVEKNIAKSMGLYCNDRIHYISKQKLFKMNASDLTEYN